MNQSSKISKQGVVGFQQRQSPNKSWTSQEADTKTTTKTVIVYVLGSEIVFDLAEPQPEFAAGAIE
jgi:hypothetical protein